MRYAPFVEPDPFKRVSDPTLAKIRPKTAGAPRGLGITNQERRASRPRQDANDASTTPQTDSAATWHTHALISFETLGRVHGREAG